MESSELANFLAPFLPYFVKTEDLALEEQDHWPDPLAWRHAMVIWKAIRPSVNSTLTAQEAAEDVAAAPRDQDNLAHWRKEVRRLLARDPMLTSRLHAVWIQAQSSGLINDNLLGKAIMPADVSTHDESSSQGSSAESTANSELDILPPQVGYETAGREPSTEAAEPGYE